MSIRDIENIKKKSYDPKPLKKWSLLRSFWPVSVILYRKQGKGAAHSLLCNTLDGKLLSSWPLFHTQPGRSSYFLNLLDCPDSILNAFTHTFSSGLKILFCCFSLNITFTFTFSHLADISSLLCFSLNSQSFIILLPSFSTAGLLFMVLRLVILPLYCFLSELLSRIRQLAYHRDMIYRIYKWHSPCGAALILFDFGKNILLSTVFQQDVL